MTVTQIQQKTKFIQKPNGQIAEVILPYKVYQELLELKAHVDATLQSETEEHIPNAETRQAIYEAEQGKNLIVCENADDLFKKLGI